MTEVVCARSENTFILKAAVSAMCNPPQPGDESYEAFLKVTSDFHILLLWFRFFFCFFFFFCSFVLLFGLFVCCSFFFCSFIAEAANCS